MILLHQPFMRLHIIWNHFLIWLIIINWLHWCWNMYLHLNQNKWCSYDVIWTTSTRQFGHIDDKNPRHQNKLLSYINKFAAYTTSESNLPPFELTPRWTCVVFGLQTNCRNLNHPPLCIQSKLNHHVTHLYHLLANYLFWQTTCLPAPIKSLWYHFKQSLSCKFSPMAIHIYMNFFIASIPNYTQLYLRTFSMVATQHRYDLGHSFEINNQTTDDPHKQHFKRLKLKKQSPNKILFTINPSGQILESLLTEQCSLSEQCLGDSLCVDGVCSCANDAISLFNPSTKIYYCHPKRKYIW